MIKNGEAIENYAMKEEWCVCVLPRKVKKGDMIFFSVWDDLS
jgi:hypothetical protein